MTTPMTFDEKLQRYGYAYAHFFDLIEPINEFGCIRWKGYPQVRLPRWDPDTQTRGRPQPTTPAKLAAFVAYGHLVPRMNLYRLCNIKDCIAPSHRSAKKPDVIHRNWAPSELIHGRKILINGTEHIEYNPHYPNEWERPEASPQDGSTASVVISALRARAESALRARAAQQMGYGGAAPLAPQAASVEPAPAQAIATVPATIPEPIKFTDSEKTIRKKIIQEIADRVNQAKELNKNNPSAQTEHIIEARPLKPLLTELPDGFELLATKDKGTDAEIWIIRASVADCERSELLVEPTIAENPTYGLMSPRVLLRLIPWTIETNEEDIGSPHKYTWINEEEKARAVRKWQDWSKITQQQINQALETARKAREG